MFTCGVIVSPVGGGRCEEQPGAALTMFSLANGMSTTRWFEFELQREEGKQLPQVCGWLPPLTFPLYMTSMGFPDTPSCSPGRAWRLRKAQRCAPGGTPDCEDTVNCQTLTSYVPRRACPRATTPRTRAGGWQGRPAAPHFDPIARGSVLEQVAGPETPLSRPALRGITFPPQPRPSALPCLPVGCCQSWRDAGSRND